MNSLTLTAYSAALFASSALFAHNGALRLILLLIATICATRAAFQHRAELRLLPPIWWAFLLWAAWAALSLTWSIEPDRSLKEFKNEVFYVSLAFLACYIGAQAPQALRIFSSVFAAALGLLCAMAVVDYFRAVHLTAAAWAGGPGNLSSALSIAMPLVLAAAWYAWRQASPRALIGALALTGLILAAGYTTLNRTIWAAFGIQLVLLAGFLMLRRPKPKVGERFMTACVTSLLLAAFAVSAIHVQEKRDIGDVAAVAGDPRLKIWPEVSARIMEAPLTGYGFGRGLLRESLTRKTGGNDQWHSHNLFLDTALQSGIPGLVLFLILIACIVKQGLSNAISGLRSGDDARAFAYGLALTGVVAGMVVRNLTDVLLVRQNSLLFWSVTGLLLGSLALPRERPGH